MKWLLINALNSVKVGLPRLSSNKPTKAGTTIKYLKPFVSTKTPFYKWQIFKVKCKNPVGLKELVYLKELYWFSIIPEMTENKIKQTQIMLKFTSTFLQTKANLQWWAQRLILFFNYLLVSDFVIFQSSFISPEICAFIMLYLIGSKAFPQTPPYMCLPFPALNSSLNLSEPFGLYHSILEWLSCTLFLSPQLNSKLSEDRVHVWWLFSFL